MEDNKDMDSEGGTEGAEPRNRHQAFMKSGLGCFFFLFFFF